MLKGIPKIISPDLLKVLMEMGHGDEIVIGDGNFPGESINNRCKGDTVETPIWDKYTDIIEKHSDEKIEQIERFDFYERAKNAYAVVMTGESALYANIILKKGVVTK